MIKLKRRKGRKQCKINVSQGCGPGRNVATATVHEIAGVPNFYPIRVVQRGAHVPRSKGVPICKACACLWQARWMFGSLDLEELQYKMKEVVDGT